MTAGSPGEGIRIAGPQEFGCLREIEEASDQLFAEAGIGPFHDEGEPRHLERAAIVLVSGDPPVGFASVEIVDGAAHLSQLSVLPSASRRGRGSALLTAVCDWAAARGFGAVTLTTFRDVPWNGPFYARRGFLVLDDLTPQLAAIRHHEKAIGDDALGARVAMRKELDRAPGRFGHHGSMPRFSDEPRIPDALDATGRATLRRKKERGSHQRALVHAILDEGLLCHVGFSADGSTFVLPMAYARVGDTLYLHGATGNHMLRLLADRTEVCVTVALLDALVLARSAFHHSMNYRSVMIFGMATRVVDDDEKRLAMIALLDHIVPGRSGDTRLPSLEELRATLMVRLPITEGSAKVRTGGPIDEPEDLMSPVWAGIIPLSSVADIGIPDGELPSETVEPPYVRSYPTRGMEHREATPSGPVSPVTQPGG